MHDTAIAGVRRWRADELVERTATPRITLIRTLIPAMVTAGVLTRRGRYWFGRARDIDAWLTGQWPFNASAPGGTR